MKTKNGFTLIELSLYMVLFSIILLIFGSTAIILTQNDQDTVAFNDLSASCGETIQQLARHMKEIETIDNENSIFNSDNSQISYTDKSGLSNEININSETEVLEQIVDGNQIIPYHNTEFTMSKFRIERYNESYPGELISVEIECQNNFDHQIAIKHHIFIES